jgi:tetratricopeptide (TPR) repeat protein
LEQLIGDYPTSDQAQSAYFTLAGIYRELGQTDQAISTLEAAVASEPDNPIRLDQLAWSSVDWMVNLDRALTAATRAVDISKNDPRFLDTLAEVLFAQQKYAQAVEIKRKVAEELPDEPAIHSRLVQFEAASRTAR